jgi:hypothetical protein
VDEIFTDHATVRMWTYMVARRIQLAGAELIKVGGVRASPQQSSPASLALLGRAKAELEAALEEFRYHLRGRRLCDYLLNMPVSSLTSERVQRLEADAVAEWLSSTPAAPEPLDMWMKELDELRQRCLFRARSQ